LRRGKWKCLDVPIRELRLCELMKIASAHIE
jgi:hypothetical protein